MLGGLQIAGIARASLWLPVGGVLVGTLGWRSLLVFLFGLPAAHWHLLGISAVLWPALVLWERRAGTPFPDIRRLAA